MHKGSGKVRHCSWQLVRVARSDCQAAAASGGNSPVVQRTAQSKDRKNCANSHRLDGKCTRQRAAAGSGLPRQHSVVHRRKARVLETARAEQARVSSLKTKDYTNCNALLSELLSEVRKLDDKPLLVEIHLVESRLYYDLRNFPRSRAALTAARTAAGAIYCPPALQAAIDMQAGIINSQEKDFRTGFSYFVEAFDAFQNFDTPNAVLALKYMLLCKIMSSAAEEVGSLIDGKSGIKFAGPDVEAMRAVAAAYKKRSLDDFTAALSKYSAQLKADPVIFSHLDALYDGLLEQNLIRLLEPFSSVQVGHVADLIHMDKSVVEQKLSQMILDKKFSGILDQGSDCLISFEAEAKNACYSSTLDTISSMSLVVDALFQRAAKLA